MKERAALALAVVTISLVLASGVAIAATVNCPNKAGRLCVGTAQNDTMYGTARRDDIRAYGGDDEVRARANNDWLAGGAGDDTVRGGRGDDIFGFTGAWGQDSLGDASGTDTLDFAALASPLVVNLIASADDEIQAEENTVNWRSSVVVERVFGGSGSDRVVANDARNLLVGNGGGDDLSGGGGKDILRGGRDFDFLRGGRGADHLEGGSAGDSFIFEDGWGTDVVADGSGFDILDFNFSTTQVRVDLIQRSSSPEARAGKSTVDLEANTVIEQALGGFADDTILGNDADNALEGDEGDDTVNGRGGADGVGGGGGDDTLTGGPGPDIIGGRKGDDTFYAADGEADEIACGDGFDTVYYDPDLDEDLSKCDKLVPRN
jgi:Ca2+-binding RTX toxin-like protein